MENHLRSLLLGKYFIRTQWVYNNACRTSIQLAEPPFVNQSTVSPSTVTSQSVLDYAFKVKIGDKDNVFDGIYGFWTQSTVTGTDFDLSTFYSYHSDTNQPVDIQTTPFYADPTDGTGDVIAIANQKLTKFAALIDPFTSIHAYTALLPIKQLQLAPWVIDHGINRIAAFFRIGPILVDEDVPPYDATKEVTQDYRLDDDTAPTPTGSISVPSVKLGEWNWLQPFIQGEGDDATTVFNALEVDPITLSPPWKPGPYVSLSTTFVEIC